MRKNCHFCIRNNYLMFVVLFSAILIQSGLYAQLNNSPRAGMNVTNGTVNDIGYKNGIIYLAGSFSRVGEYSGHAVNFDSNGLWDKSYPKVNGNVYVIIPDGSGGWYLGGAFTAVGGYARNRLVHILSNKTVDPNWNPAVNNTVKALTIWEDNLYIGGSFSEIDSVDRKCIASVKLSSGNLTSWNPEVTSSYSEVSTIEPGDSTLYVGGNFSNIGGADRYGIAELDTSTGSATNWDPHQNATNPPWNTSIYKIIVKDSVTILGGQFAAIGDSSRTHLAMVSRNTGALLPLDYNITIYEGFAGIYDMALPGNILYVAGGFDDFGGQTRSGMAAIDLTTELLTSWDPNVTGFESNVKDISIDGNTLYLVGDFTSVGDSSRNYIASVDLTTGAPSLWNPDPGQYSICTAISANSNTVFVGGPFVLIEGVERKNLAAIDESTGQVTSWDPMMVGWSVNALEISGNTMYVGGSFNNIGGQTRNRLAQIDLTSGLATSFDPGPDYDVQCLLLDGSVLYVGGGFWNIGGQLRKYLAAIDTATGLATGWDSDLAGQVRTMVLNNNILYIGGDFTAIGTTTRNHAAAIDLSTGLTTFDPDVNSTVRSLSLVSNTLFIGGFFSQVGGNTRSGVAAFDIVSGNDTGFDPNVQSGASSGNLYSVAAYGNTLFVGGFFSSIGDSLRYGTAAIDISTEQATSWDPGLGGTNPYARKFLYDGSTLYMGGSFENSDLIGAANFAVYDGGTSSSENTYRDNQPSVFYLSQNYPNPFNPMTTITYSIPETQFVTIKVYNILGEELEILVNQRKRSGYHKINFNGNNLASGVYLYQIKTDNRVQTRRMMLIK